MKVVLVALAFLVAIAGALAGYIHLTTVTDVAIGPGWRLVAAARAGTISADPSESEDGEVITDQERLEAVWTALGISAAPPRPDFAGQVAVRATTIGSGSCPNHLDGAFFAATEVVVRASKGFWMACSGDAVPYTFVLIVERDHLPPVPFTLVVASDDFVREVPIAALD